MTIRFLVDWNGYRAGQVATLGSTPETRLVAAKLATTDLTLAVTAINDELTDPEALAQSQITGPIARYGADGALLGADGTAASGAKGARVSLDSSGFDVSTATAIPAKSDGGETINYRNGSATCVLEGGYLTANPAAGGAWYGEIDSGGTIAEMACEFAFTAGSGGTAGCLGFIPWESSVVYPGTVPGTGFHFTLTRWAWSVDYIPSGGGVPVNYAGGGFDRVLSADTLYRVRVAFYDSTAFLSLPDGTVAVVAHAKIAEIARRFACFEFYRVNATDDKVKIKSFWYSARPRGWLSQLADSATRAWAKRAEAKSITSIASGSIGTTIADIDASSVFTTFIPGTTGKCLVTLSAAVTVPSGGALIVAPKLVRLVDGATLSASVMFSAQGPVNDRIRFEAVVTSTNKNAMQIVWQWRCTTAGASASVAGTTPLVITATPVE